MMVYQNLNKTKNTTQRRLSNSYTKGCLPVRGDNTGALASPQTIIKFTEGVQWFYCREKDPEGSNIFRGGGGGVFKTHITCDFSGGFRPPFPPLDPHMMVYQNLNKNEKYHPMTTK